MSSEQADLQPMATTKLSFADFPERKRGRPRKGEISAKVSQDPNYKRMYHLSYYHKNLGVSVQCPKCGRDVSKQKLKRHQATELCNRHRLNTYREAEETDVSIENEEEVAKKGWFKEDRFYFRLF